MSTNICVLKSGGEYAADHVYRLAKQVPDLVCLTDLKIDGVKTIPLITEWRGWWAKIELFRPDIQGDLFYIDLDTTVINMPVMPSVTTVLRDFTSPDHIGSGLMYIKQEDKQAVWDGFIKSPRKHFNEFSRFPLLGDQGYLYQHFKNAQKWQDIARVYSYKLHCKQGIPGDADVVCFHGRPRPWDIGL